MNSARRTRRWAATISALALALTLASCGDTETSTGTATEDTAAAGDLRGVVRTPPLQVDTVSVPDALAADAPMTMQAPEGELLLVYFGYTSCPDVCPTTMSDLMVAIEQLPDDLAGRVSVAMVTVDPERDTAEILSGYLGHFFERSHPLRTTDADVLAAATSAFGVQYEIEDHAPGESYDVAHTAVTYVVDDTGAVVVEWPFGFGSDDMAADLTTLLEEERT